MYLATVQKNGKLKYIIRKSFYDKELCCYYYRQIFDLGENPGHFIEHYGDDIFYFKESLEDQVALDYGADPTTLLEDILWDFLPAEEKKRISMFRRSRKIKNSTLSTPERTEIKNHIHMFDRRRLYYIRYGAVDQSRIFRLDDKIYRPLLFKCRDEKEYYFLEQEKVLKPTEFKTYIYAIFNIQHGFKETFASFMPEALDQAKVEEFFIEELCKLNGDQRFWQGQELSFFLHAHLQRYLIKFFDYDYKKRSYQSDFFHNFSSSHRKFRWPERKAVVTEEESSAIFGVEFQTLKSMKKEELTRLFRQRAKELHPDSGGDHEGFIKLLNAYDELKRHLPHSGKRQSQQG